MPRILPRLIKKISEQLNCPKFSNNPALKRRKTKKSLHKPVLSVPSFHPKDYSRSILLAPDNPVTNSKDYVRHKTLPPTTSQQVATPTQIDPSRQMTKSEFGWWANPYLRMLISPLRKCLVTQHHLPTDFLVRLIPVRANASRVHRKGNPNQFQSILVPDGLLHPKYTGRATGGGMYVLCWRRAISRMMKGFHYSKLPGCIASPRLDERIAHLLRLRVLQEFELLAERLEFAARTGKNPRTSFTILRRLTREEWGSMKSTSTLPYENAVAALILPPIKKDTITKKVPVGSMSASPPTDEQHPQGLPPVSTLLPASSNPWGEDIPHVLPLHRIPLYNGITAFPSRSQRSALHSILLRILDAERTLKYICIKRRSTKSFLSPGHPSSKPSHAFLLYSDAYTARRGDPASIAVALWRLRMYESGGWLKDDDSN